MMKNALRQQRHRLKKKYFDPFPLHMVRKISPIKLVSDKQWNDLVEYWKDPKRMVCMSLKTSIALFMLLWHVPYMYIVFDVGGK